MFLIRILSIFRNRRNISKLLGTPNFDMPVPPCREFAGVQEIWRLAPRPTTFDISLWRCAQTCIEAQRKSEGLFVSYARRVPKLMVCFSQTKRKLARTKFARVCAVSYANYYFAFCNLQLVCSTV